VRPLRADAERNRTRLLEAAAKVFAIHGPDASGVQIAREANVGQGTLYRRFRTKDELFAAIATGLFDRLAATATELLALEDPGKAVHEFLGAGAEMGTTNRSFIEAMATSIEYEGETLAAYLGLTDATRALLARAQSVGAVRDDIEAEDLFALVAAISNSGGAMYAREPNLWRRYLDLIFDCLRPAGAHPLSYPAPTSADLGQPPASTSSRQRRAGWNKE
jgi:AcrR family transcriptional regulator